ncbi:helix-turn-helix domain-containing protein [Uliginosibacterium sp. sgz301328]|uniref:helix-turn-helix domain-containing protein n=1 Tax=Uliginosibacterium sp. sgz301328 TaxID=3243764 RepID=UPI00359D9BF7
MSTLTAQQLVLKIRSHGLSQAEIARRAGLSQGAVSHIETGRRKQVYAHTLDSLRRIAATLDRQQKRAQTGVAA